MTKKYKRDEEEERQRLMWFLAESVSEMSDEQIKAEFGHEPGPSAKGTLSAKLKELKKKKLVEARVAYESSVLAMSSRTYKLPRSNPERRALLSSVLSQKPELRAVAFTAQHRELKDLTDSDVESFLKQLAELGVLDSFLRDK